MIALDATYVPRIEEQQVTISDSSAHGLRAIVIVSNDGSKVATATTDPWLHATLRKIAAHKNLSAGWDGGSAPAPTRECLDSAEALAILLSPKSIEKKPYFAVDCHGQPNFAMNSKDFYLHLTVDDPGALSWYAINNGEEIFEDAVAFNGTKLPKELATLFD